MYKRRRRLSGILALVLAAALCFAAGRGREVSAWNQRGPFPESDGSSVVSLVQYRELEEKNPETGQYPAPIFSAMALVLCGLGISALADKRNHRDK